MRQPTISHANVASTAFSGGLLALGRLADAAPSAAEQAVDQALNGALAAAATRQKFMGKPGQVVALDTLGQIGATRVVLIGLGKAEDAPVNLRDYATAAAQQALSARLETVGLTLVNGADDAQALTEGAILGTYTFDTFKKQDPNEPAPAVTEVTLLGDGIDAAAIETGKILADAVSLARDLLNEPAHACTPQRLADVAREIGQHEHCTLTIFGRDELEKRGWGGFEAVARGATREPQFIHINYAPPGTKPEDALALVGKGITFDAGGLSLKPTKSMIEMHMDMGGAAAVLGAMKAIVETGLPIAVHGIVGACENMPGANAYRPSDILTISNGKTVEVLNTDAEGRLVLSDCLHYAEGLKPKSIIDLATLTGACLVALGPYYAGVFSDDEGLVDAVNAAAKTSGELFWRLPMDRKVGKSLKSKRADVANIGGPWGGSITAALFLSEFVESTPWLHLDIAGPTMADKDDGYVKAGGTGFAVLTLHALAAAGV
ncbi:MAG: leucyl aminopeptidase [Bradymonadia bacterium]